AVFLKLLSELDGIKNAALLIIGVDLNGRVPPNYMGVTGSVELGEPDYAGWAFVDTLANLGAWIPSTYESVHSGDSETYRHPSATAHRIDFIALGGRATLGDTDSWVNPQFDNGSPNVDHHMLQVKCSGAIDNNREGRRLWRPRYDRDRMATQEGRTALHEALCAYEHPGWEVPADQHCQRLQTFLADTLETLFPAEKHASRASYIPDIVWDLRRAKNHFKARVRHRRQMWQDAVSRAFRQWHREEDYDVDYLVAREGLMYNLAAAAINTATSRIKKILNVAKNDSMRKIATEGHQGVIQQERDDIWLNYFGEQEMGERLEVANFIEAYKNSGTPSIVENYRSLFISSFLGKSYHKTLRTLIGPEIEQLLHPLHCGTRQSTPVAFPGIYVLAALRKLARDGRSCATLYVDTKAAYYKVVRDLATGCIDSDAQVISLFRAFGLDDEDLHDMMATIRRGGMIAAAGVNSQLRHAIKDLHPRTWFVTTYHGGGALCWSKAGSRPGESFADVIYAFIYSRVLYRVHEHLVAEELNFTVEWEADAGVFPTGQGGTTEQAWEATWADDSAYVVEDECPNRLVAKARRVGALVLSVLTSHGMQPNLRPGKTSFMVQLRGPGSTTTRRKYFNRGKAALTIPDLALEIPTVCQYRHLGGVIDLKMTFKPEVRHRLAVASQAYESAKKLLLHNKDLELPTRVALFEITVATSYFNLALWKPSGPAWTSLCAGHARLVRKLLTRNVDHALLFKVPLPLIMWVTKCLPIDLLAKTQRLSLLVSLVQAAPGLLWGVLQEEKDWMATVREDLRWATSGREKHWPMLGVQAWPDWWRVLHDSPQRLKRLVKCRLVEEQEARIIPEATELCLWAMARTLRETAEHVGRTVVWQCRQCKVGFDTKASLSVHYFKKHGRVAMYRLFTQGTKCRACGTECWSEGRLAAHLRAAPLCVGALQAAGCRADRLAPGFGSRVRRKSDVEQYTPAATERDESGGLPGVAPTWHPSVVEAYNEICDIIQDELALPY
ncbi:unnamed protein product, partial [Symbiodinium necroappetens]